MSANFVSLHNHTEYSFLDGAIRVKDMVARAKEFGMPALAITDHGGLFGAAEFYNVCMKEGIKPVLGFEAYMTLGSRFDKNPAAQGERGNYHLVLLAANNTGWHNLMRLSTIGYTEGFYSKPRIDMDALRQYSEGIIATSACAGGAVPQAIIRGDMDGARKLTEEYLSIFGKGNFYFELQDHNIPEEKVATEGLIKLGREMGIPFIVANDAHYLRRDEAVSHEILLCIGTQAKMTDEDRYKFPGDPSYYFKSPEEMAALFPDIPEALTNTLEIAERCDVNIKKKAQLPSIQVPQEFGTPEDHLVYLSKAGLKEKYADITPELEERLNYELKTINEMGFASYFLIVGDFVRAAHDMGIMTGCRGSVGGSLVAYVLGIANVDPIKYDLIFERFLNPERVSMPDADIDVADRDRQKVIDYIVDKYGRDAVCQIITFGTLKPKAATKDVARVLGVPIADANNLTKMVTEGTLKKSYAANSELAGIIKGNEQYRELFRHAEILEGLVRNAGTHPAGVIIAPSIVTDWAPLYKMSGKEDIMAQFDMDYIESIGLVKMDILGLRTLTVIQETLRLIKKYHGITLDRWKLPEDDEKTFALFGKGETTGIFQFESHGMREYLSKLKPSSIEDLIAMVALYRPGPMDNIDMFIARKHGREKIKYDHPMLEDILRVTYGVIVYQEQVMRIAQVMGNFSLGSADLLRRAMGKKEVEAMEKQGAKFIEGAAELGVDAKTAKAVFDLMAKFAGYGFNKSHAAAYAHLSYQTAYLKVHYPLEYMTANLTAQLEHPEQFQTQRAEAEKIGIKILPPDVNYSDYECGIYNGTIRLGLTAIKNVGKAAESIIAAREEKGKFTSIFDLCKSVDLRLVNKRALESLICAGAFDEFEGSRAQHFEAVDMAIEYGNKQQKDRDSGQVNLFDDLLSSTSEDNSATASLLEPALPKINPWTLNEKLQREKDTLGFYASGHPLDQYYDEIRGFSDVNIASEEFAQTKDGTQVTIGGLITSCKPVTSKRDGKLMCSFELETFDASMRLFAFAEPYAKFKDILITDAMVLVRGKISNKGEAKPELLIDNCVHLSLARDGLTKSVHIRVASDSLGKEFIESIHDCCSGYPGYCALIIHVAAANGNEHKIKSGNITISPDRELIRRLREMLGKENVWIAKTAD